MAHTWCLQLTANSTNVIGQVERLVRELNDGLILVDIRRGTRPICPQCGKSATVIHSRRGVVTMRRELGCRSCGVSLGVERLPLTECVRSHKRPR